MRLESGLSFDGVSFVKGHGTQNDFVVLADPAGELRLTPERVAALCDRRAGVGADGVLRAVRAGALLASGEASALPEGVGEQDWFMDYRNADGQTARMCGNGARVFAHFLRESGLESAQEHVIGTRAGARLVRVHRSDQSAADVSVKMGPARVGERSVATLVSGQAFEGVSVDVGNPHLVCLVPELGLAGLAELDLSHGAGFDPVLFPDGVNVEFVVPHSPEKATLRVHERGSGETRACGTGSVASAAVVLAAFGTGVGEVVVASPGGQVQVRVEAEDSWLRGPSELVAAGVLNPLWWSATA